ncbi:MAG: hypothetical protein ACYC9O_12350 [Candidatus Latescibacterota bacterium]
MKVYPGDFPAFASGRITVRDNPFLNSIFTLDFTTVLAMLRVVLSEGIFAAPGDIAGLVIWNLLAAAGAFTAVQRMDVR